jgi:hypothetical protein
LRPCMMSLSLKIELLGPVTTGKHTGAVSEGEVPRCLLLR